MTLEQMQREIDRLSPQEQLKLVQHISTRLSAMPLKATKPQDKHATASHLLHHSGLIGLWKDRDDIVDSTVYARTLREAAQRRQR